MCPPMRGQALRNSRNKREVNKVMCSKTLWIFLLGLSIFCYSCAAEIEYWTKRMEESKTKSAGGTEAEAPKEETTKKVVAEPQTPPPVPAQPVARLPVEWPPRKQTPVEQRQETKASAPEPVPVAPAKAIFIINLKGGEKYTGEILQEELIFKTTYGPLNIKPDNLASFSQEELKTRDGTNLKATIDQEIIKIKTDLLGELEIKTADIESITR